MVGRVMCVCVVGGVVQRILFPGSNILFDTQNEKEKYFTIKLKELKLKR